MATAIKTRRIPDHVLAVLSAAEVEGNVVRLTCGQLDRKVYEAVNDVLVNLGGKWKTKVGHVFAGDPKPKLDAAILTGEIAPFDLNGYFPTPPEVVELLLRHADMDHLGLDVLEPSAGEGAIADAARLVAADVVCVELDQARVRVLAAKGHEVLGLDFLALSPEYRAFDRCLMNPPFARQQDIDHVLHAWKFLKPGGRLVSVMAVGFTFREDRKSAAFREFVAEHGDWEALPDGAFKASGTGVRTVLVVLGKAAS